jgi:hypothetical protein
MSQAIDFLMQSQNPDGGWGYRVRGMSYVEPTSAVLLALTLTAGSTASLAPAKARDFLKTTQHADGGWGIAAVDEESGWMTAWATWALAPYQEAQTVVERGVIWLIATEGIRVTDAVTRQQIHDLYQMDGELRGWPWQKNDAAWVHPTALAILALVAAGRPDEPRVRDGTVFLIDRGVASGGWNIGNPQILDKTLAANIQDTSIALCALAAAKTSITSQIDQSIRFLKDAVAAAKTPAELAWGMWACHAWKAETGDSAERLYRLQSPDGSWRGNPFLTSIAILAARP